MRLKKLPVLPGYAGAQWLVKKIDSTLRGNIAAEVMALQQLAVSAGDCRAGVSGGRAHYQQGKCLVMGSR
jgi:uncharacterized protein YgbK (DUF1537 family)